MPLPASAWAGQIGRSTPSPRWPLLTLDPSSDTADADHGDDVIPATQAAPQQHGVSPSQRFKSLSNLTGAIQSSPRGGLKALHSIQPPPLTQNAPDPVATLPRPTQPLTSNALQFDLQSHQGNELSSTNSSSSDEHTVATKAQKATGTAALPRLPSHSLTPQSTNRPAPVQPKDADQPVIPASTGSDTLDAFLFKEDLPGVPPGGAIELIGPTASAKTQWAVQIALRIRAAALGMSASAQPATPDDHQVLIIDTEGAITSHLIQDIASALAQQQYPGQIHADQLLAGVRLVHASTLAHLIATLRILQSPHRHCEQAGVPFIHHIAAVVLDSTSYHLRSPPDMHTAASADRTTRRYLLSMLNDLHANLSSLNPHLRLIGTTQMALKMFTSQGQLVNYRVPDSVAWLVPQVGNNEQDHTDYRSPQTAWNGITSRGPGVLGPAATRLVLFRGVAKHDFGQRWAHVIFHPAQDATLTVPLRFSSDALIVEHSA